MKTLLYLFLMLLLTGCASRKTPDMPDAQTSGQNEGGNAVYEVSSAPEQTAVIREAVFESGEGSMDKSESPEILYAPYRKFGMVYEKSHNRMTYNGQTVRWFEDYYPVGEGAYAGTDFFDKTGTVDVYAERDFTMTAVSCDGSYDPSGRLTGLKAFTQEEFDRRDISPLLHPEPNEAVAEEVSSEPESEGNRKVAAEYAPFGVAWYDTPNGGWYYKGEKIYSFKDILTSNGEDMSSGNFKGILRCFGNPGGTVSLTAVRDYSRPNAEGYGTLTGIERCEEASRDIILSESPSSSP